MTDCDYNSDIHEEFFVLVVLITAYLSLSVANSKLLKHVQKFCIKLDFHQITLRLHDLFCNYEELVCRTQSINQGKNHPITKVVISSNEVLELQLVVLLQRVVYCLARSSEGKRHLKHALN